MDLDGAQGLVRYDIYFGRGKEGKLSARRVTRHDSQQPYDIYDAREDADVRLIIKASNRPSDETINLLRNAISVVITSEINMNAVEIIAGKSSDEDKAESTICP